MIHIFCFHDFLFASSLQIRWYHPPQSLQHCTLHRQRRLSEIGKSELCYWLLISSCVYLLQHKWWYRHHHLFQQFQIQCRGSALRNTHVYSLIINLITNQVIVCLPRYGYTSMFWKATNATGAWHNTQSSSNIRVRTVSEYIWRKYDAWNGDF